MSNKIRSGQYADRKGAIVEGHDRNIVIAEGDTVPADGQAGYAPGCVFFKRAGAAGASHYVNEGTASSCAFKPLSAQGSQSLVTGRATTVTAADTIATGLSSVAGVVATLDDDPGDDPMLVSATIGDQAGSPAAGSFILKTWKNTGGTDPTPLAATTFAKKVNWIAWGTK